ncbi:MAG: hypothetical protein IT372_27820 [Polyangiaceae bacterium]|nr:hypothetical protein [Polyangiaceae bacterium]
MTARVVRKAGDVAMIGYDNHGGLYYYNFYTGLGTVPGPPVPYPPGLSPLPPFSVHLVITTSAWPFGDHKINNTVIVEGSPIVSKGHEAKHDVHIPPGGNLLLVGTLYFAASKWVLGVGSVQATAGPVASTMLGPVGANYNCQDPCSAPFPNLMVATASVQIEPSGSDWGFALLEMVVQSLVEFLMSVLLELPFVKGLFDKLLRALLPRKALRLLIWGMEKVGVKVAQGVERAGAKDALERHATRALEKEAKEILTNAAEARAREIARQEASGATREAAQAAGQRAWEKAWKDGMKELNDKTFKPPSDSAREIAKAPMGDKSKDLANQQKDALLDRAKKEAFGQPSSDRSTEATGDPPTRGDQ